MKPLSTAKHAKLSASGAYRWMNCAGSIKLSEKAPPPVESSYAVEGTLTHEVLEILLKSLFKKDKSKSVLTPKLYQQYGQGRVLRALDAANEIIDLLQVGDEFFCEQIVSLDFIHPDMFGTLDAAIVSEFGRLTIIDYKDGAGVCVEPEENPQLLYYGLAIAHRYDYNFSEVALRIIQPRAYHPVSTSREWVTDIAYLKSFGDKLKEAVGRTQMEDPTLNAGDWCRWCPASSICPEISSKALKQAGLDFALDVIPTDIPMPSLQELGRTLSAISKLETWIDSVKALALQEAERGIRIEGFKLVNKRSARKWIDEESTIEKAWPKYGDKIYTTPELRSPAQFEKATGDRAFVQENTIDVSSGMTLVPETDRRKEVNQLLMDFGDSLEK